MAWYATLKDPWPRAGTVIESPGKPAWTSDSVNGSGGRKLKVYAPPNPEFRSNLRNRVFPFIGEVLV
jgi:hypothetical protein